LPIHASPVDERHAAETIGSAASASDADWLRVINPRVGQFNASGDNARLFKQWFGFGEAPIRAK
jgi:ABC-type amino acid transport substrate-binding protein